MLVDKSTGPGEADAPTLPSMSDHDADLDAIVAMLADAGLVEAYVDESGQPALRLTERGAQMGRALAMSGEDADLDAVPAVLLNANEP